MDQFFRGALSMACLVAGVFFLRFWKESRDRLFIFFALAFTVLALSWVGLATIERGVESRHLVYIPRLVAFVLIIIGIIDKNRRA
jgi:hypothetical protein